MKILYIVAVLPTKEKPWVQPFVKSQIESIKNLGIDVEILNLTASFGEGWQKYMKGVFRLRDTLRNNEFDLIHAHYSYCGMVGLFQNRLPLVVSLMGCDIWSDPGGKDNNPTRNRIEGFSGKFIARFSDYIIVKSQEMANLIPFKKKIRVVPNGVDFSHFMPMDKETAKSKFNLPRNKKIILFACDHTDKRKNFFLAKSAFNILDSLNPGEYFFWNVWEIDHSLMPFVLNAADVLVFTSFFEGSPNLVKEAMACNLPIVSVPVGDVPEIIRSTKNCYVADYDPSWVAEKLKEATSFGSRSNGREKIEHLRLERIAYKIESVYKNVLESQRN